MLDISLRYAHTYGAEKNSGQGQRKLALADSTVTIPDMGKKKKKKPEKGTPQGRTPGYTVFARVPPELGAALEACIKALKPKPTITSAVQDALEEWLKARGFWPPAETKEGE